MQQHEDQSGRHGAQGNPRNRTGVSDRSAQGLALRRTGHLQCLGPSSRKPAEPLLVGHPQRELLAQGVVGDAGEFAECLVDVLVPWATAVTLPLCASMLRR